VTQAVCAFDMMSTPPLRLYVTVGIFGSVAHIIGFSCASKAEDLTSRPVLRDLAEELGSEFPEESPSAIGGALSEALRAAISQENLLADDFDCNRDYSQACPQGWVDEGDGGTCSAPLGYEGACSDPISFGHLTPTEKGRLATQCGGAFPCVGARVPDYSGACPNAWKQGATHACVAPEEYGGPCVGSKSFVGFSSSEKAAWAAQCHVSWPSRISGGGLVGTSQSVQRTDCVVDYSSECPLGWNHDGQACKANTEYAGDCVLSINSAQYSAQQKEAFALACHVSWPCKSEM